VRNVEVIIMATVLPVTTAAFFDVDDTIVKGSSLFSVSCWQLLCHVSGWA
jgi:hypothetical protein